MMLEWCALMVSLSDKSPRIILNIYLPPFLPRLEFYVLFTQSFARLQFFSFIIYCKNKFNTSFCCYVSLTGETQLRPVQIAFSIRSVLALVGQSRLRMLL